MLKKFEELNRVIDKLNTDKTKADAQKEVWEKKLNESISEYAKKYGVDLSGKNIAEIKNKLSAEVNEVEAKAKKDYEYAMSIVSLIQSGDIEGAWKIIGVESPNNEEIVQEEVADVVIPRVEDGLQSVEDVIDELDDSDFLGEGATIEVEEDEEDEEEVVKENTPVSFKPQAFAPLSFDDDDDEDEFIVQKSEEVKKPGGLVMDDEDDDDDGFGGFGSILSGSKFQV